MRHMAVYVGGGDDGGGVWVLGVAVGDRDRDRDGGNVRAMPGRTCLLLAAITGGNHWQVVE